MTDPARVDGDEIEALAQHAVPDSPTIERIPQLLDARSSRAVVE
ncbi:hypothetical protein [Kribbella catacumbae]|nr:hypothetical protein [Kribbella catacumbae]